MKSPVRNSKIVVFFFCAIVIGLACIKILSNVVDQQILRASPIL